MNESNVGQCEAIRKEIFDRVTGGRGGEPLRSGSAQTAEPLALRSGP